MNKTGLSRPGAMQMVAAIILGVVAAIGPLFLAFMRPDQVWFMALSGLPAFAIAISGVGVLILFFVGFIRYCASKGYSKWIGFWLCFGHLPGFIVLLLLPDCKPGVSAQPQTGSSPSIKSDSAEHETA
jgi:hypothetical protein